MPVSIENSSYFILHANCMLVKGQVQSTINDVSRYRYKIIPNLLYEILTQLKDRPFHDVLACYADEQEGIEKYIALLLEEDWGIFTDIPEAFPELEEYWDSPAIITNAILDYGKESDYDIADVIDQLDQLGCEALEIRLYDTVTPELIGNIYYKIAHTSIQWIELLVKYDSQTEAYIRQLHQLYSRIQKVTFHSAAYSKTEEIKTEFTFYATHIFHELPVTDASCCGLVHPDYFMVTLPFWMEGKAHNNCLNRKMGIDVNGFIKNCPSAAKRYGHVKDTRLAEALSETFREPWSISKEKIVECNTCEFRMICPDCRVFTTDTGNIYAKPSKCNYNPGTGQWRQA